MRKNLDVRAVPLSSGHAIGLVDLIMRTLGLDGAVNPDALYGALIGDGAAYGTLQRISANDVREACARFKVEPKTVDSAASCAELIKKVTPWTPTCGHCSAIPLSHKGGKIAELPAGAACPFCDEGVVRIDAMPLRIVAWTDGRLVEPTVTADHRAVPGAVIPLTDEGILDAVGTIDRTLESALVAEGVEVRQLLAHQRLSCKTLTTVDDAYPFLRRPSDFGLGDATAIIAAVRAAKAFALAREPSTMPPRTAGELAMGASRSELRSVTVKGRTYLIEGLIGSGDRCDVFRARWDHTPTARVVIKLLRKDGSADGLVREARALNGVARSNARAAEFFWKLLPQLDDHGTAVLDDGTTSVASVFRDKNRFDWTLADVFSEYPGGIDEKAMVWMVNRTLMQLGWIAIHGISHGAVVPEHLLIAPEVHAIALLDWSEAGDPQRLRPVDVLEGREAYYPDVLKDGRSAGTDTDVAMLMRCMIEALGGDPATGAIAEPKRSALWRFLCDHAMYPYSAGPKEVDPIDVQASFERVTERVHGPRTFTPFRMPAR